MLDRLRDRRDAGRQDDGFTLIELLIVIVILGVLAAIVVFAVGGITDRGARSACRSTVSTVNTAAEAYYAKNGTGATSLGALVSADFLKADATFTSSSTTVVNVPSTGSTTYPLTFTPGGVGTSGSATATCPT